MNRCAYTASGWFPLDFRSRDDELIPGGCPCTEDRPTGSPRDQSPCTRASRMHEHARCHTRPFMVTHGSSPAASSERESRRRTDLFWLLDLGSSRRGPHLSPIPTLARAQDIAGEPTPVPGPPRPIDTALLPRRGHRRREAPSDRDHTRSLPRAANPGGTRLRSATPWPTSRLIPHGFKKAPFAVDLGPRNTGDIALAHGIRRRRGGTRPGRFHPRLWASWSPVRACSARVILIFPPHSRARAGGSCSRPHPAAFLGLEVLLIARARPCQQRTSALSSRGIASALALP